MALQRLRNEYKQYLKDPVSHYSICPHENNFLIWDVILIGPQDTIFEGGIFKAELKFTKDYPNKPPEFKFLDKMFHPNIYPDGKICISILHEGIDVYGYEDISERWNPSHSVNSILLSISSILCEGNIESPANVDASKLWKENFNEYKKIIYKQIANG